MFRSNVKSMLICFFDTEGIMRKEFVPPGQTVNGNFYCDVLRRLRENVWRKRPVKWCNNSWALHHDNAPAHTSLLVLQFFTSTKRKSPPPSLLTRLRPLWFFSYFWKWNWSSKGDVLRALKTSRLITRSDEDADGKWLPVVLPIMEIPLGSLY
jgi:hypothetical protein